MSADPHALALELRQYVINAEIAANNPDLAYPWLGADQYPDPGPRVVAAEQDLTDHLLAHRDALGERPEWRLRYLEIDAPAPPTLIDSRWTAQLRPITEFHDDPPF